MLVFATVEFWPAIVDTHIGMCGKSAGNAHMTRGVRRKIRSLRCRAARSANVAAA
jgi:hypothetical protein